MPLPFALPLPGSRTLLLPPPPLLLLLTPLPRLLLLEALLGTSGLDSAFCDVPVVAARAAAAGSEGLTNSHVVAPPRASERRTKPDTISAMQPYTGDAQPSAALRRRTEERRPPAWIYYGQLEARPLVHTGAAV